MESERNTVKVFQDCGPSVANITTSTTANVGMSMNPIEIPRGTGSAFLWDADGHVVTNYHVVMNGNKAKITLSDATTWEGVVVGVAKNKDLAVLKISAPASKLKPIVVGSSQVKPINPTKFFFSYLFGLAKYPLHKMMENRNSFLIHGYLFHKVISFMTSKKTGKKTVDG